MLLHKHTSDANVEIWPWTSGTSPPSKIAAYLCWRLAAVHKPVQFVLALCESDEMGALIQAAAFRRDMRAYSSLPLWCGEAALIVHQLTAQQLKNDTLVLALKVCLFFFSSCCGFVDMSWTPRHVVGSTQELIKKQSNRNLIFLTIRASPS